MIPAPLCYAAHYAGMFESALPWIIIGILFMGMGIWVKEADQRIAKAEWGETKARVEVKCLAEMYRECHASLQAARERAETAERMLNEAYDGRALERVTAAGKVKALSQSEELLMQRFLYELTRTRSLRAELAKWKPERDRKGHFVKRGEQ